MKNRSLESQHLTLATLSGACEIVFLGFSVELSDPPIQPDVQPILDACVADAKLSDVLAKRCRCLAE